jgi:hypothetical protein
MKVPTRMFILKIVHTSVLWMAVLEGLGEKGSNGKMK